MFLNHPKGDKELVKAVRRYAEGRHREGWKESRRREKKERKREDEQKQVRVKKYHHKGKRFLRGQERRKKENRLCMTEQEISRTEVERKVGKI